MSFNEILTSVNSDLTTPLNKKIDVAKINMNNLMNIRKFSDVTNLKTGSIKKLNDSRPSSLQTILDISGKGYLCGCLCTSGSDEEPRENGIAKPLLLGNTAKFKLTIDNKVKLWLEVTVTTNSNGEAPIRNEFFCSRFGISNFLSGTFRSVDPITLLHSTEKYIFYSPNSNNTEIKHGVVDFSDKPQTFRVCKDPNSSYGHISIAKVISNLGIRFEKNCKVEANWGIWNYAYFLDEE